MSSKHLQIECAVAAARQLEFFLISSGLGAPKWQPEQEIHPLMQAGERSEIASGKLMGLRALILHVICI